jgi:DNA (cytosine-5)-methyltransferase 1
MTHIDLFSGIGGFAYAAQQVWPDYHNLFFCDNNKFCQAVIRKNFGADSLIYDDIREVTIERVIADTERRGSEKSDCEIQRERKGNNLNRERFRNEPTGNCGISVDLLTGGFPCQPFSHAGKRKGTNDNRFLWPEMLRIIREFKPTWIISENVAGLISMAESVNEPTMGSQTDLFGNRTNTKVNRGRGILYRIIGELEQIGYAVQVFCIPACAVNAPHRRDRVWIVAHANHGGEGREIRESLPGRQDEALPIPNLAAEIAEGVAYIDKVQQIAMLPTLTGGDWKGERGNATQVCDVIEGKTRLGNKTGLKLQPAFVEWMMGYPSNWTDLNSPSQSIERKD